VGKAGHLGTQVELVDLLFEQPDLEHLAVTMEPALISRVGQFSVRSAG
jgi:hypothetical protein